VFGALTRLLHDPPSTLLWLGVAGPLAAAVVVAGAVCWRRGDRVLGAGLGALAMVLASPVSWSHHWVWAVPVGLALWERNRWAGILWTAVFVTRPFVWLPWGQRREYRWSLIEHIPGNAYLLAAVALSIGLAVSLSRQAGPPAGNRADHPYGMSSGGTLQNHTGEIIPDPQGSRDASDRMAESPPRLPVVLRHRRSRARWCLRTDRWWHAEVLGEFRGQVRTWSA
jgi:hypothetical protein